MRTQAKQPSNAQCSFRERSLELGLTAGKIQDAFIFIHILLARSRRHLQPAMNGHEQPPGHVSPCPQILPRRSSSSIETPNKHWSRKYQKPEWSLSLSDVSGFRDGRGIRRRGTAPHKLEDHFYRSLLKLSMINTPCYRKRPCGCHRKIVTADDCAAVKQVRIGFITGIQLAKPCVYRAHVTSFTSGC